MDKPIDDRITCASCDGFRVVVHQHVDDCRACFQCRAGVEDVGPNREACREFWPQKGLAFGLIHYFTFESRKEFGNPDRKEPELRLVIADWLEERGCIWEPNVLRRLSDAEWGAFCEWCKMVDEHLSDEARTVTDHGIKCYRRLDG